MKKLRTSLGTLGTLGTRAAAASFRFAGRAFALFVALLVLAPPAIAGPENYTVVHGNVLINHNGNLWIIQNGSPIGVVQYDSFDISSFETVQFLQAADAKILNYIANDFDGTQINGSVLAQGTVYFANPAGVIFGNGAVVNAGQLYAAAANLGDLTNPGDLQAALTNVLDEGNTGMVTFGDVAGPVTVEQGAVINAAGAHFVGNLVANHGQINIASDGVLTMSAGTEVVILGTLGGTVSVQIPTSAPNAGPGVTNGPTGEINAAGAQVVLGAGDMYSLALQHGGGLTAGDLTVNGAAQIDADVVATGSALFDGAVGIGADANGDGTVEIAGLSSVEFTSTVDGANDLVVLGSDVTFGGAVGATETLASLVVLGDALIEGGSVATTGAQTWGGDVTVGADTSMEASSLLFTGAIDAASFGGEGLSVTGSATFGGAIGAGQALKHLFVFGPSVINGGAVTTTGQQEYNGPVTLGTYTTMTGDLVHFVNELDAQTAGIQGLEVIGDAHFSAGVGGGQALASLDVTGASLIEGGFVTTTGSQTYGGATTINGDTTLTGTLVSFLGTVDDTAAGQSLLDVDGNAIFGDGIGGDEVGGAAALRAIDISGASVINAASITTTDEQVYVGAVALGTDTVLNASDVAFSSTVNGATPGMQDLTVNADSLVFGADVGGLIALGNLVANTNMTGLTSATSVTTVGDQFYAGTTSIGNEMAFNGNDITFGGLVEGFAPGGVVTVNLDQQGVASFLDGAALANYVLSVNGGVRTDLAGDFTVESIGIGNDVLLVGDTDILGHVAGEATFGGDIDGAYAFTIDAGTVVFEGDIGASTALDSIMIDGRERLLFKGSVMRASGDISLQTQGGQAVIEVPGSVLFDAGSTFRMGQGTVLASLGEVNINATTAILGDIAALGDISVDADEIAIMSRPARLTWSPFLQAFVIDLGTDFVTGGQFFFSTTPTVLGDGVVLFGSIDGRGDALLTLSNFGQTILGEVTARDITGGSARLRDLAAFGPTTTNIATAEPTPMEVPEGEPRVIREALPGNPALQRLLQDLQVRLRPLEAMELFSRLTGRGQFDDMPRTTVDPTITVSSVAVNRVPLSRARACIDAYDALVAANDASVIKNGLATAWNEFAAESEVPTPMAFAEYLAQTGKTTTLAHLEQIDALLRELLTLGLTIRELQVPFQLVVDQFFPEELTNEEIRQMLEGLDALVEDMVGATQVETLTAQASTD